MNNAVKNGYGETVGFRCWTCGDVFQSMWGETCNRCRKQESDNDKLCAEISRLSKALETLKEQSKINEFCERHAISPETLISVYEDNLKRVVAEPSSPTVKESETDLIQQIFNETTLETKLKVMNQMAMIDVVTEMGYRSGGWKEEEDPKLAILCKCANDLTARQIELISRKPLDR